MDCHAVGTPALQGRGLRKGAGPALYRGEDRRDRRCGVGGARCVVWLCLPALRSTIQSWAVARSPAIQRTMITALALALVLQSKNVTPAPTPPASPASGDSTAILILRAQLDEAHRFRSDLVETVNTSLATIVGLGVLLVGFSWFSNFRVLEREKLALQQQLENDVRKYAADFETAVDARLQTGLSRIHEDLRARVIATAEEKVSRVAHEVSELTARTSALGKVVRQEQLRRECVRIMSEARYWEMRKVPANEVDRYRELLRVSVLLDEDPSISTALAKLIAHGESGVLPYWGHVPELTELLEKLPARFSIEKARLLSLLTTVKQE